MRDVYNDQFNNLKLPDSVKTIDNVATIQVEIRGLCHNCEDVKITNSYNKGESNEP